MLDVSPPALGGITISGNLVFANKDLNLTAKWIMLMSGSLQIGTETQPYVNKANITLTATDPAESVHGMGTRGIMVMGGALELHGRAPTPVWTKLNAQASGGATALTLANSVNWVAGDQVVVAPTDYLRLGGSEAFQLSAASGTAINLTMPLARPRWGSLQYVTSTGITLTPTAAVTNKIIDERAEIANLTRNIVIQAPDDTLWASGFGAQVMIMRPGVAHVEGVRFKRMGQAGKMGRYPFHWHLWSYAADGTLLSDATGQYIKNSVVAPSAQRCVVIHGTNGARVENNICYDIKGHAIFLEDAVERRNIISGNLILGVRAPVLAQRLLEHEGNPSGFWLTNPDNTVTNNAAADSSTGFWLAYPTKPLGLSKLVVMEPNHLPFGVFDNNQTHSNGDTGVQFDFVPYDDQGHTTPNFYQPVVEGFAGGDIWGKTDAPFTISRMTIYKMETFSWGGGGMFWNRAIDPTFSDFVMTDFGGTAFRGASNFCKVANNLIVGSTLNNENAPLYDVPSGAASYHSQCQIFSNVFVNLPAVPGKISGAFRTDDYYTQGLDMGLVNNVNNTLINTHPGYRVPSPNTLAAGQGHENWTLAGALWDPQGLWGAAGNYWVYDHPYLTGGTTCTGTKNPVHGNDKSCAGPYYGFGVRGMPDNGSNLFSPPQFIAPILYHRNDNGAEWFVDDGKCTWKLSNMRGGAMVKGGSYSVSFPAGRQSDDRGTCTVTQLAAALPAPKSLIFGVTNLHSTDDGFILSVPYSGAVTPTVYRTTWSNWFEPSSKNPYGVWASWTAWRAGDPLWKTKFRGEYWNPILPGANIDAVKNGNGDVYYQDRPNNVVWILIRSHEKPINPSSLTNPTTFVLDNTL